MFLVRSESIAVAAALLAQQVAAALRSAVRERATASLLVPGGRTPVPFFHQLRRQEVPWSQVVVSLTDERWVVPEHAASNARLVRAELLAGAAASARFVPLHNRATSATEGAAEGWRGIAAMPQPFDAVVLGMGEDGHFASLFPGSTDLAAALDVNAAPACVPMRAPSPPFDRLSLNLAALARARHLYLFITGSRKLQLMESAGARAGLPVDALLALKQPMPAVHWAPED